MLELCSAIDVVSSDVLSGRVEVNGGDSGVVLSNDFVDDIIVELEKTELDETKPVVLVISIIVELEKMPVDSEVDTPVD